MPKMDWGMMRESDFAFDSEIDVDTFLAEAFALLCSADPVERDFVGYPALATWIEKGHLDEYFSLILLEVQKLFHADQAYTRSFAALVLAELVARDLLVQILSLEDLQSAISSWGTWYLSEDDLRGWVEEVGWIHALAHGADVAAYLGQHPQLTAKDLNYILEVFLKRITDIQKMPLQYEEDRIALAIFVLLHHQKLTQEALGSFFERLAQIWQLTYGKPRSVSAAFAAQVGRSLLVFTCLGASLPNGVVFPPDLEPTLKTKLLDALKKVFPAYMED